VALVLGGSLIAIAPLYVTTGFYKSEMQMLQQGASGFNSSNTLTTYGNIANQAMEIAFAGAILAAAGAAALVLGIVARMEKEAEKAYPPAAQIQ